MNEYYAVQNYVQQCLPHAGHDFISTSSITKSHNEQRKQMRNSFNINKAIDEAACAMHCSPPRPNSVVYGQAYSQGMSVSGRKCREVQS